MASSVLEGDPPRDGLTRGGCDCRPDQSLFRRAEFYVCSIRGGLDRFPASSCREGYSQLVWIVTDDPAFARQRHGGPVLFKNVNQALCDVARSAD